MRIADEVDGRSRLLKGASLAIKVVVSHCCHLLGCLGFDGLAHDFPYSGRYRLEKMFFFDVVDSHILHFLLELRQVLRGFHAVPRELSNHLPCLLPSSGTVLLLHVGHEVVPVFIGVGRVEKEIINTWIECDVECRFEIGEFVLCLSHSRSVVGSLQPFKPHQNVLLVEGRHLWLLSTR